LECLKKTQGLIDCPFDGQVIHRDLPQNAPKIDQVARAEHNPFSLNMTPALASNVHGAVREQRDAQMGAEATCSAGLLRLCMVQVLRVGWDGRILLMNGKVTSVVSVSRGAT